MRMTGAEAVVKALELNDVDVIFGYPGAANSDIYDALMDSGIHHVLVRHEQAAAHAANGYARITGKTGVCMATSGPGATNLITGIATAYMDSIPMVAITGQVPVDMIGRDVFQEVDITGATQPFTKHNYLVKDTAHIPRVMREAFHIASTGRPGPVLIDIPKDVGTGSLDFQYPEEVILKGYKPTYHGHPGQIKRMIKAIEASRQPVICTGGGVLTGRAEGEVVELAERIKAPVATTLMGIGAIPSDHPLSLGMLGNYGVYAANRAVSEADLLIVLGARMGDRATGKTEKFAQLAHIIHIDIDPAEIGKNINTDIPIVGDIRTTLRELLARDLARQDSDWLERVEEWKGVGQGTGDNLKGIDPMEIFRELSALSDKDTILVTDVGQHQIWAGRYYRVKGPRTFLTSGGLGTMGYGLPAAIGAELASSGKVVLITGDGSFQMSLNELATIKQEGLATKIAIFNNGSLGMVRELQQHCHRARYYQTRMKGNPDFVLLAKAYGIEAIKVSEQSELAEGVKKLLEWEGPIIVEFAIDPTANVIPVSGR